MHRFLALLLLTAILAGCADEGATASDEPTTQIDDDLVATDDTGVIRGVVVDAAIVPISGVTVTLQSGESATSLDDGSFGFSDLEPGTYFLTATKPGYDGVQSSAEVVAGVALPPVTRVQMTQNLSSLPFVETSQYAANLRCGLAIPSNPANIGAFGCSVIRGTEEIVGENNAEVKVFETIPDWFQTEMYWRSTQPAGDSLILDIAHCCDNDDISETSSTFGPSPLTAWATKEEILAHEDGAIATDGIEIRVFPHGNEAIRDATGERVGVILDQSVNWISNEFYNFIPDEGWTFIEDGAHAVPT